MVEIAAAAPIMNTRDDGLVGCDVHVAYSIRGGGEITGMWLGTKQSGPILQWDADGTDKWDGTARRNFRGGAWATLYSRGDYGRNYACGGHWSSQTLSLLGQAAPKDESHELLVIEGHIQPLPPGIAGDLTMVEVDCSPGWSIWYASAREALAARIPAEMAGLAKFPRRTIEHLERTETPEVVRSVMEVVDAYGI